ncbi:hypothetical protein B484DRAFT_455402, partial [Ochromonadaceae sp. CCMP2298]
EGVALLLMQKGLGIHAAKQAAKYVCVWCLVTFCVMFVVYSNDSEPSFIASVCWQSALLAFYACLWLVPQKRFFRRPAAIFYGKAWTIFRSLSIFASVLFYTDGTHEVGGCIYVFGTLFPFAIFEPVLLYYTLLADSRWWQGLDIRQGRRVLEAEEIRSPLQGIDLNLKSAQSLAQSMDTMGTLNAVAAATLAQRSGSSTHITGLRVESRPESLEAGNNNSASNAGGGAVKLLNFAYISLDKTRQLGSGSFSRVYLGKYRRKPCAIKLIFTLDLTLDVIRRIAAEAQLLSLVRHPNVVGILGVAVLPPSVCILLELCAHGSLGDVLRANAQVMGTRYAFAPLRDVPGQRAVDEGGVTVTRLGMRGFVNGFTSFISYSKIAHSHSAGVSGTEGSIRSTSGTSTSTATTVNTLLAINPSSSSVTSYSSRAHHPDPTASSAESAALSLSWTDRLAMAVGCARGLAALHAFSPDLCHRDIKSFNFLIDQQLNAKISDLELGMAELLQNGRSRENSKNSNASGVGGPRVSEPFDDRPSIAGNEILANWAAPEVIYGSKYTQAADMYSFALVLWEILVGRVPYSDIPRQDDVRRYVGSGQRPLIPSCFTSADCECAAQFRSYVDLIVRGWAQDAASRPTAAMVLAELEELLRQSTAHLLVSSDATNFDALTADVGAGGAADQRSVTLTPQQQRVSASLYGSEPPLPSPAFLHRVLGNLRAEDDGAALHRMEASGALWVLCLPHAPHAVVWATHCWCAMSGLLLEDVIGLPLHALPIFPIFDVVSKVRKQRLQACAELSNAVCSLFSADSPDSTAREENAISASAFFKSLRGSGSLGTHAVLRLLDNNCRAWNSNVVKRKRGGISRRIMSALKGQADSATAEGAGAVAGVGVAATAVWAEYSLRAFPVYHRSPRLRRASDIAIPAGRRQKPKSGYFNIGSFTGVGSPGKPSQSIGRTPSISTSTGTSAAQAAMDEETGEQTGAADGPPPDAESEEKAAPAREGREVAFLAVQFSCLKEPQQLFVPFPDPDPLPPSTAGNPFSRPNSGRFGMRGSGSTPPSSLFSPLTLRLSGRLSEPAADKRPGSADSENAL